MENNRAPPSNYLEYFGADISPLLNFYEIQKKQEMQRKIEAQSQEHLRQLQAEEKNQVQEKKVKAIVVNPTINVKRLEDDQEYQATIQTIPKCNLHPIKPSLNCRVCKRNREQKEKLTQEFMAQKQSNNPESKFIRTEVQIVPKQVVALKPEQEIGQDAEGNEFGVFQISGDQTTFNMNPLLRNNILSAQYYQELISLNTYEDIIGQIEYHCKNAEAFTLGTNNLPSTLFCCLL